MKMCPICGDSLPLKSFAGDVCQDCADRYDATMFNSKWDSARAATGTYGLPSRLTNRGRRKPASASHESNGELGVGSMTRLRISTSWCAPMDEYNCSGGNEY